jgi:glutathione synthase/RimK-type ligase-like ATP-grasp enzyme
MPDIYFEIEDSKFYARHRKLDLMDFDVFIFRSVSKVLNEALLLADFLKKNGKVIIDESLATAKQIPLLNNYLLAENNIPQLNLYQTNSLKSGRDVLMEIAHPVLLVSNKDDKKNLAISEDWTESYDIVRTSKQKKFVFHQYINLSKYNRVYVIGGEVIGGLEKEITEEEPKLNHSQKSKNRTLAVTEEMGVLAVRASAALNYEISAVDIVSYNDKLYVLSVHRAPRFSIFQRVTKINFAQKIVDYAVKKTSV